MAPLNRRAFWTAGREQLGSPPPVDRVFDHRTRRSPETGPAFTEIGPWMPPQWAEPEGGALPHLTLLQYLPAQPPAAGRISSLFGLRRTPYGTTPATVQLHEGIDIAVPVGTPVVAPGPGTVVGVGHGHRFGTYVRLRHEQVGLESLLAHLSSVEPGLHRGRQVHRGQVIGHSGNSGRSTGPHLHVEFRTIREQVPVDPLRVYALYTRTLDHVSDFPIASVHAQWPPYRIEGTLRASGRDLPSLLRDVL